MPKGKRQQRNPIEKIQSLIAQLENTVGTVMEHASKPDFAESIRTLMKKREEDENKKTKLNKSAREVVKLLQKYPGLGKFTLSNLKSKISEYKKLNVLSKYETDDEQKESAKKA